MKEKLSLSFASLAASASILESRRFRLSLAFLYSLWNTPRFFPRLAFAPLVRLLRAWVPYLFLETLTPVGPFAFLEVRPLCPALPVAAGPALTDMPSVYSIDSDEDNTELSTSPPRLTCSTCCTKLLYSAAASLSLASWGTGTPFAAEDDEDAGAAGAGSSLFLLLRLPLLLRPPFLPLRAFFFRFPALDEPLPLAGYVYVSLAGQACDGGGGTGG